MTIWFVSRHPGAVEWAKVKGLSVDRWEAHLSVNDVAASDIVIGVLPVNMAARICERGARYMNLSLDLPLAWRGRELSAEELILTGAQLEEFVISSNQS